VAWAEAYLRTKWHLNPYSRLATIHAPKSGSCCVPFLWVGSGPHLTQCRLGRGLPPYQVAFWSIQPFGHNSDGPKIGGCAALGELGSHATQCGRAEAYLLAKFHLDPSNRLVTIHQRYRQTGQTDKTGQTTVR